MPSKLVMLTWDGPDGPVDPGYGVGGGFHPSHGLPGYGGGHPSHGLPGFPPHVGGGPIHGVPEYPSQGLPGGGHISLLPVFPFDPTLSPDNSLPGQGGEPSQGGERPDNTLPGNQPTDPGYGKPIRPGMKFMVKWIACVGLALVPDNSLPSGGAEPK